MLSTNSKSTAQLFVLFVVFFILGIIVYQSWQESLKKTAPIQVASPTSAPVKIANWKTYINPFFGFSLKHPENLTIPSPDDSSINFIGKDIYYLISQIHPLSDGFNFSPCQVKCTKQQITNPEAIQQIAQFNNTQLETYNLISHGKVEKQYFSYVFYQPSPHNMYYAFLLINPDVENKNIFDQIVSTFKISNFLPEDCGACPQFTPPHPDWCKDGTRVAGEINVCGCQGPPRCVYD